MADIIDINNKLTIKTINNDLQRAKMQREQELYNDLITILAEIVDKDLQFKCKFCNMISPKHSNSCLIMKARRLLDRLWKNK